MSAGNEFHATGPEKLKARSRVPNYATADGADLPFSQGRFEKPVRPWLLQLLRCFSVMRVDIACVTTDRRPVFSCDDYLQIRLPSVGSWVVVQVTHIFSPSHVCVCFPYGFSDDLARVNGMLDTP